MRSDGNMESRSYDAADRITGINNSYNTGKVISRYDYIYDAADNIISKQAALTLPYGMKATPPLLSSTAVSMD